MSEHRALRDEDIHAYIDGALDDARQSEVAALLDDDPVLAHRVAQFQADKAQLKTVYGDISEQPLPRDWIARIERGSERRRSGFSRTNIAAFAAVLLVALGVALAYRDFSAPANDDIVADALAARGDAVRPQTILPPGAAQANVLTAALGTRAKIPDLSKMGYRLARFQIYPATAGRTAVELVYRDAAARVFTLYLRRAASPPRFDQFERDGIRVCIWQDDVLGTVMAGKMSAAEMQRLASLSYTGLTL
jgi:anti-sigma factor RsiW